MPELGVRHQRKSAIVLVELDRTRTVRNAHPDRALEVLGRLPPGLKFDLRTELLHRGVDRIKWLREAGIEIVVVEHAAAPKRLPAVVHHAFRKARVAVALPGPGAQRIDRKHQPRLFPGSVIGERVGEARLVRSVVEAGRPQPVDHCALDRDHERLRRVGHAAGDRHLLDQRPRVEARGQLLLQAGPGLSIGRAPEMTDNALFAVEYRLDWAAAELFRPVRRLETAPHPELDPERPLRISFVVSADLGEGLVDDVAVADLGVRRRLQLLPARNHDDSTEDAGLGIERFERIDRIAAVTHEAIGSHGDEPADRRFDVLCGRRVDRQQKQARASEYQPAEGEHAFCSNDIAMATTSGPIRLRSR